MANQLGPSLGESDAVTGRRVLMVTGEYPPAVGGVADYTAQLRVALEEAGWPVSILTNRAGAGVAAPDREGEARATYVDGWGFGCWPGVARAARLAGASVIHIQYQAAAYAMQPAVNLLPAYLRWRLPAVSVVTTFHDLRVPFLFPKAGPLRRQAIRILDRLSHASVLTNQSDLEALGGAGDSGGVSKPRRWLIPLASAIPCEPPAGFTRSGYRGSLGVSDGTLLLCYFGLMNHSKGVEILVRALRSIVDHGTDARLLMLGGDSGSSDPGNEGYARSIDSLIARLGLDGRVIRTGFVDPREVSAGLLASDMCVLPFRDGASLRRSSLLAALTHAVPVVTTHPLKPEPLLVDGENVAMVRRDDPAALGGAILRIWADATGRERLARGASEVSSRFTWQAVATLHAKLYDALLGGSSPPQASAATPQQEPSTPGDTGGS